MPAASHPENDLLFPVAEYKARRERVLKELERAGAAAVVFAGDGAPPLHGFWSPDWNFWYLTGIEDEAQAAVMFDPTAEDPRRRIVLFLRPLNPELEEWDGLRHRIGDELKRRYGFETVLRTLALPRMLSAAARRCRKLACLHPFAVYDAPASKDLATYRKVCERAVGIGIDDLTNLLPALRAEKSAAELDVMTKAIAATASGYDAVMKMLRPGVTERDVQRALENGFAAGGGAAPAYNSIVGSGINGTVLHYNKNSGPCNDGDLLVIDAGARFGTPVSGYCADITRTYPVSGTFTKEQRELYNLVLRAQEAAINAVKPGVRLSDVDAAARAVIDKAGLGDAFMHGIGHQLGIEVHDVTPDGPLKAGMVITIEPGVYFQDRALGIRIEDDILVTPAGPKNLSSAIIKTADDIEAALKKR